MELNGSRWWQCWCQGCEVGTDLAPGSCCCSAGQIQVLGHSWQPPPTGGLPRRGWCAFGGEEGVPCWQEASALGVWRQGDTLGGEGEALTGHAASPETSQPALHNA